MHLLNFSSFVPYLKKNWLAFPIFCLKVVRIQNVYFKFNGKNITPLYTFKYLVKIFRANKHVNTTFDKQTC